MKNWIWRIEAPKNGKGEVKLCKVSIKHGLLGQLQGTWAHIKNLFCDKIYQNCGPVTEALQVHGYERDS